MTFSINLICAVNYQIMHL